MFENILHINSFVVVFPRGSHWCALPPPRDTTSEIIWIGVIFD